jgi:hypothetical protein
MRQRSIGVPRESGLLTSPFAAAMMTMTTIGLVDIMIDAMFNG